MLSVDIKVNNKIIRTIHITNYSGSEEVYKYYYDTVDFKTQKTIQETIYHKRSEGALILVQKVLKDIQKRGG